MTLPDRCAVIGGGRMGAGIAHALLLARSRVQVLEATEAYAEHARANVLAAIAGSARRGTLTEPEQDVVARLEVVTAAEALAGCGLVVEAVPEDLDLKLAALTPVAAATGPEAVVASNTSSLPIGEIAAALPAPERVLGLHFFNPVPASLLVEVVVGDKTAQDVVDRAVGWVELLGKSAVVVKDSPGFASSRLGVALGIEAIRMVEEGVASAADIDAAMTLGYKHPVGPLRLTDLVGLDVRLGIAEHLARTLGPRFAPPQLMRDMVARGDLGRKSGRGFYDWSSNEGA